MPPPQVALEKDYKKVLLEKHGITATQEFADPRLPDDGDLNREAKVLVPEADYERAYDLFYTPREDEL